MAATSARIPRGMSLCSVYRPYKYPRCWFPVFRQKSRKRSAIVWFSNMMLSTCLYFCLTKFKRQGHPQLGRVPLPIAKPFPRGPQQHRTLATPHSGTLPGAGNAGSLPVPHHSASVSPSSTSPCPARRIQHGLGCGEALRSPQIP